MSLSRPPTTSGPYVCGFCARGWHRRCPRTVEVGKKVAHGPTKCTCRDKEHSREPVLFQ